MTFKTLAVTGAALTALSVGAGVQAQERYLGEIFMTGANFCPRGTANADGQLLPIAQNTALFSLFGTIYGGDGRSTFALPDLRGRSAVHVGQGPGLGNYSQGQRGGAETVTLTQAQLPAHSHEGIGPAPQGGGEGKIDADTGDIAVDERTGSAGGSQPVNIRDPYLAIRYCVVMQGIYPSRN